MSRLDDEKVSAEAFERALIDSARDDAPALDAERAWAKFASAVSQVATSAEPGSGLHPAQAADRVNPHANLVEAARRSTGYGSAIQWLLLGAIGGSALTAAWFSERRAAQVEPRIEHGAAPASSARRAEVETPTAANSGTAPALRGGPATTPLEVRDGAPAKPRAVAPAAPAKPVQRSPRKVDAARASVLAAEIARLDAARNAREAGDSRQAIALVDQYHREFPHGALAPDAEVLAIEALADEHNVAAVAQRGASFLWRYPADPHAARVRALLVAVK